MAGSARTASATTAAARLATRAALVFAVLGFVPAAFDPFDAPKASVLAVFGLAALAVGAFAVTQRLAVKRALPPPAPLDLAVAAWGAVALLATAFGIAPRLSWLGEPVQREGLRTTLALIGLYVAARFGHDGEDAAQRTLAVLLAAGTLAAAYALVQVAGRDPLAWSNPAWYPAGAARVLRPGATLGNPTLLGALLAATLALAVAQLALGRGDRAWLVPAAALTSVALLATLSRGALLAALVASGAAAFAAWRARPAGAPRRIAVALASAALPALAWGALVLRAPLAGRVSEGVHGESAPARVEIGRSALALWRAHPLLGVGPDAFGLAFPRVQTPALWSREWIGLPVHAHSVALQVLATLGILGALAGLAWLVLLVVALRARWRWPATRPGLVGPLAVLVALVVAGAFNAVGPAGAAAFAIASGLAPTRSGTERRTPHGALALGIVAALVFAVLAVPEWRAGAAAGRAHGALDALAGAPASAQPLLAGAAWDAAARATVLAPGEDLWWRLAADAALARAEAAHANGADPRAALADAERAARAACALRPERAANEQRLANALAARARIGGEPARFRAADAAYAEAERLAPCDGLVLADEARAELGMRDFAGALVTAHRIAALYPHAAHGHAIAAAAQAALGERDSALVEIALARAADWEDGSEAQRAALEQLARALGSQAP